MAEVISCDDRRAACRCGLGINHDGPHICGEDNENDWQPCGGSWLVEGDEIVTYVWPRTGFGLEASAPSLPYRQPWPEPSPWWERPVPRGAINFHLPVEIDP